MRVTWQASRSLERVTMVLTARAAYGLVSEMRDGLLTDSPPYQRASVWSGVDRIRLIETWMLGLPVPAVTVNDRGNERWRQASGPLPDGEPYVAVIDGKQRLTTARLWFDGQLLVPASWFPAGDVLVVERTGDGPYTRFTMLSEAWQRHSKRDWLFPVNVAKVATVHEEAMLYLRYNQAGVTQTAEDMDRAAQVARNARLVR
jgi:hypothetical protein